MLKWMINEKREVLWIILHVLLGISCAFSKFPFIIWVYLLMVTSIILLINNENKDLTTIKLMVYLVGIEQINRSIKASPFVPHEVGKYGTLILLLIGFIYKSKSKGNYSAGTMMLFFSISGFIGIMGDVTFKQISFNYFGLLNLALCMIYFNQQKMTYTQFLELLKILMFPIISFTTLIIFKQQQDSNVVYGLTANFETSGGSASNQVSAVLGFAFAVMALLYLSKQKIFKLKYLDIVIMFAFLFRGLLTFSRGGVITGILAVILVLILPKSKSLWANHQISIRKIDPKYYIFGLVFFIVTFFAVNVITGNYLLLRYQGYSQHSLKTKEVDLNDLTSDRLYIAESDIVIFANNPFFGVGIGQSFYMRRQYGYHIDALPHIEVTRMLAEHGIFGGFMAIIFLGYPIIRIKNEKRNFNRAVMVVFFAVAVITTFHGAMRTILTPILYGIGCLQLIPDKPFRTNGRNKSDSEEKSLTTEQLALA